MKRRFEISRLEQADGGLQAAGRPDYGLPAKAGTPNRATRFYASTASFAATPALGVAQPTTANTNRDGTGTLSSIVTGAANGTRIDRVEVVHAGPSGSASSNNVLRLYLYDGVNTWLFRELAVSAQTPSATAAGLQYAFSFPAEHPLVLKSGWILKCALHTYAGAQDKYNWAAIGGDL